MFAVYPYLSGSVLYEETCTRTDGGRKVWREHSEKKKA